MSTTPRTRQTLLAPASWTRPTSWNRQIGMVGVALASLGGWLMLPPLGDNLRERTDSVELIPIYLGILAIAAGLWVVLRQEWRWGWASIVAGLVALSLIHI